MDTLLPPVTLPRPPLIHPSSNAAASTPSACHPTSSSLIHDSIIRTTTTTNSHPPASFLDHIWDENHIFLDEESFFGDCSSLNDLMCIGDIGDTVQASWLDIVDASSGNCINKKEIAPLAPLNKPTTAVRRERKVPRKSANFMSEKNVLKDRGKCTHFVIKSRCDGT